MLAAASRGCQETRLRSGTLRQDRPVQLADGVKLLCGRSLADEAETGFRHHDRNPLPCPERGRHAPEAVRYGLDRLSEAHAVLCRSAVEAGPHTASQVDGCGKEGAHDRTPAEARTDAWACRWPPREGGSGRRGAR